MPQTQDLKSATMYACVCICMLHVQSNTSTGTSQHTSMSTTCQVPYRQRQSHSQVCRMTLQLASRCLHDTRTGTGLAASVLYIVIISMYAAEPRNRGCVCLTVCIYTYTYVSSYISSLCVYIYIYVCTYIDMCACVCI